MIEVDEARMRENGMSTASKDILARLDALRAGRRLSLQSSESWLPVKDLRVRQKLPAHCATAARCTQAVAGASARPSLTRASPG
jgi:hypothetical protein